MSFAPPTSAPGPSPSAGAIGGPASAASAVYDGSHAAHPPEDEAPPAYGYPAGQHPAFGAHAGAPSGSSGQTPGYTPAEGGTEATLADLDERELPKGWERCYDGFLGHCFYVYTPSDPPLSTWLHPLDRESDALGDGFADAELQAYRHATLGTKLKNLATGKSQAERHQAKAAKDKLMNDQYEDYLRSRREARGEAAATRYPVPTEAYPMNHPSGRYKGNVGFGGNGIGFGQPGLRSMAFLMGYGAIGF